MKPALQHPSPTYPSRDPVPDSGAALRRWIDGHGYASKDHVAAEIATADAALGALADMNTVGTAQINPGAVTLSKLAAADAPGTMLYWTGFDWVELSPEGFSAGATLQLVDDGEGGVIPGWVAAG